MNTQGKLHATIQENYSYTEEVLFTGHYHMVILDHILDAIGMDVLTVHDILNLIEIKPYWVSLILPGRSAPVEIVKKADTVTEMIRVKHHFVEGVTGALEGNRLLESQLIVYTSDSVDKQYIDVVCGCGCS